MSITQQDFSVILVQDGVLHACITSASNCPLEYENVGALPDAENRHAIDTENR